jgi:hypothetical protein
MGVKYLKDGVPFFGILAKKVEFKFPKALIIQQQLRCILLGGHKNPEKIYI